MAPCPKVQFSSYSPFLLDISYSMFLFSLLLPPGLSIKGFLYSYLILLYFVVVISIDCFYTFTPSHLMSIACTKCFYFQLLLSTSRRKLKRWFQKVCNLLKSRKELPYSGFEPIWLLALIIEEPTREWDAAADRKFQLLECTSVIIYEELVYMEISNTESNCNNTFVLLDSEWVFYANHGSCVPLFWASLTRQVGFLSASLSGSRIQELPPLFIVLQDFTSYYLKIIWEQLLR